MLQEAELLLQKHFGYKTFREGQAQIIESICSGRDTFAIMPTGAGKSICYQIPALQFPGITLVISPLISLMKDQLDALESNGISATFINSSLKRKETVERLAGIAENRFRLIYVAPERLDSEEFLDSIKKAEISFIAIDEAHCVSQWGHDFRKSYREIPLFVKKIKNRPVVAAFTATATEEVEKDIVKLLQLKDPLVFMTGFDRPNLRFSVLRGENKDRFVLNYLAAHPHDSGIIYAATRKEVDKLAEKLEARGYRVGRYHAGMKDSERQEVQEQFIFEDLPIMVATNAFGMGIDKSNVRFVIHYNLPKNMEAYYQEAGRAGRDGEPSECIVLYSPGDIQIQKFLIEQSINSPERKKHEYQRLQFMSDYAHTSRCLRSVILEYFGENTAETECGNCSNCDDERQSVDVTVASQKILSCVFRMQERYGLTMIADVLKGSKNQKVRQMGFDRLPTYGIMAEIPLPDIKDMINFLVAEGYLQITEGKYPLIRLTAKSKSVLQNESRVFQRQLVLPQKAQVEGDLFEALRVLRRQIALRDGVAPYIVFGDETLREMSVVLPLTKEKMAAIKGVGERKLQKYGAEFIQTMKEFLVNER